MIVLESGHTLVLRPTPPRTLVLRVYPLVVLEVP
jgi:hypothetical protein